MPSYFVSSGSYQAEIAIADDDSILVNGEKTDVDIKKIDTNTLSVVSKGGSSKVLIQRVRNAYQVLVGPFAREFIIRSQRDRLIEYFGGQSIASSHRLEIRAPMPALVVKVEVEEGQSIESGDGLVKLEAMKMENELKAHRSGIIKRIHAVEGKAVEKGELLMVLE